MARPELRFQEFGHTLTVVWGQVRIQHAPDMSFVVCRILKIITQVCQFVNPWYLLDLSCATGHLSEAQGLPTDAQAPLPEFLPCLFSVLVAVAHRRFANRHHQESVLVATLSGVVLHNFKMVFRSQGCRDVKAFAPKSYAPRNDIPRLPFAASVLAVVEHPSFGANRLHHLLIQLR